MKKTATLCALAAAALYAVNIPLSRLLLNHAGEVMMAAFLYFGAGAGLALYGKAERLLGRPDRQEPLTGKELPWTIAMVLLDIAAPILLMEGIARTSPANVSLLNNFEIVTTSVIALALFHEVISAKLWLSILMVTAASMILSFEGDGAFTWNTGSLLVLGACVCWGFENNCTRMISNKSSTEIVVIKGCFSGLGSFVLALILGENMPKLPWICAILLLGFISYGLSIKLYITAQKNLGAAKTSAYYSIAPFLGAALGMALPGEKPGMRFWGAMALMIASTVLTIRDSIALQHTHEHEHTHTHEHLHGTLAHSHEHTHRHTHTHVHTGGSGLHEHTHDRLTEHEHLHDL